MSIQKPGVNFPPFNGKYSWTIYYADGFDYACQNAKTGDLFFGGGDVSRQNDGFERFANPSDATESRLALAHLRGVLPSIFGDGVTSKDGPEIRHSWTGVLCNSLDSLPLVGRIPQEALDRPEGNRDGAEWISAGYGGYGMTNSWLCGHAVADMVLGLDPPVWLPEPLRVTSERMAALFDDLESKVSFSPDMKAML